MTKYPLTVYNVHVHMYQRMYLINNVNVIKQHKCVMTQIFSPLTISILFMTSSWFFFSLHNSLKLKLLNLIWCTFSFFAHFFLGFDNCLMGSYLSCICHDPKRRFFFWFKYMYTRSTVYNRVNPARIFTVRWKIMNPYCFFF